ncbi:MAG: cobalamin B12-binding domain-containing protein [Sulfolobales archaeon]|nr:cobalamin B12-binding domain-containing protein [Sulfolobales archaeon]MDW7968844.1 cobalamin B12-binding domain-containing protein [Sulfolobales archaeon]
MATCITEAQQLSVRKVRVLIAKLGLDGHDRGAKVIARALRDAGFEVIYLGVHQTPEEVVKAAIEEDVSVIGISILSGSHVELVQDLVKLLKEKGLNIPVVVGGIIPPEDVSSLKSLGVYDVCGPGTLLKDIVEIFRRAILS